jgi:hypothetical protein
MFIALSLHNLFFNSLTSLILSCRSQELFILLQLEEYGALYQRCAWGPLLALMIDPDTTAKKIPWEKEKVSRMGT